jgi:hypothetical protein
VDISVHQVGSVVTGAMNPTLVGILPIRPCARDEKCSLTWDDKACRRVGLPLVGKIRAAGCGCRYR